MTDETIEQNENEIEEEEEELVTMETSEQEFVFRDFVVKFAKPEILKAYVLLIADFQKNSTHTNHCCVKMLHRIAYDLGYIGMVFQISLFRVFQKIISSPLAKTERYKEISKFATYIVRRFVEVAENNKTIFVELLFWKSLKDSIELVEGYGSYQSKGKVLWTEDAEMEVRRLFEDYKENDTEDKDTVDCIMERITDPSKTRGQIIRELKRQELIESAKDLKKPKGGSRAGPWREEDELELQELYDKYRDTDDPVSLIMSDMCKKRSRAKVMEKILSMGLASDRRELYKKRGKSGARSGRRRNHSDSESADEGLQELPPDFEEFDGRSGYSSDASSVSSVSDSDSADDGDEGEVNSGTSSAKSAGNMTDIIKGLVDKGYKDQLSWIQRIVNRTATDREEEDENVGVPIVPLTEENETAMEDEVFLSFMEKIGMVPPANEQEAFWRIPEGLSPTELRNIALGLRLDENNQPIDADRIKVKTLDRKKKGTKEKKKREKKDKPKKNASKFAALKDLVKKRAKTEKTKRITKKSQADETGSPVDEISSPATDRQDGTKISSGKKGKRVKNVVDSSDSDDDLPLKDLLAESQPDTQGSVRSEKDDQLLESQSQPLNFLNSSDESDQETGVEKGQNNSPPSKAASQTSKRSRSSDSDTDASQTQTKKRVKLLDSDSSDDDDDKPLSSLAKESFPATLYTQGTESESDLDDHLPIRKVIQKKNIIESDDED